MERKLLIKLTFDDVSMFQVEFQQLRHNLKIKSQNILNNIAITMSDMIKQCNFSLITLQLKVFDNHSIDSLLNNKN